MSDARHGSQQSGDSWETYWHGAERSDAFTGGGSRHASIGCFWEGVFDNIAESRESLKLVDIAGGSGSVVERATNSLGDRLDELACVDLSPSAMKLLQQRFPEVRAVVADARDTGLESGCYDIVTSQFGMEYAGPGSIEEMMRLAADGGLLAMLVHHRGGGIYRQCRASYAALREFEASNFVESAISAFEAGFAASRGGERHAYETAAKRHVPAIRAAEAILRKYGQEVADGTIVRLYKDVAAVHRRLARYDPDEVLGWMRQMQSEIDAYAGRMASMCEAAIDESGFGELCRHIESGGFRLLRKDALIVPERNTALAWAIVAVRAQQTFDVQD